MTNKKNSGSAGETLVPAEIEALQAKLQNITKVMKLAEMRSKCMEHLDYLETQRVQHSEIEDEREINGLQKIVLRFEEGGNYEIRSPKLLDDVQTYLMQRFKTRIVELEAEIKQSSI